MTQSNNKEEKALKERQFRLRLIMIFVPMVVGVLNKSGHPPFIFT